MGAQVILSILLGGILLYAWTEFRRSPAVSLFSMVLSTGGLYFVWVPAHSTYLAELVGIGRGADLILYVWVCISLILLLNLHLKLRMQMELITMLARKLALTDGSPRQSGRPSFQAPSSERVIGGRGPGYRNEMLKHRV